MYYWLGVALQAELAEGGLWEVRAVAQHGKVLARKQGQSSFSDRGKEKVLFCC